MGIIENLRFSFGLKTESLQTFITYTNVLEHSMNLTMPWYYHVQTGIKTIEIRVNDPKRQEWEQGDQLLVSLATDTSQRFRAQIIERQEWTSFREAINGVGLINALPNVRTLDEAIAVYESIPGYPEKAKVYGVVSFRLQILDRSC